MDNLAQNNKFEWFATGNAPLLFPTELATGAFIFDGLTKLAIPQSLPFATAWGKPVSKHLLPEKFYPAPKFILIAWFSIVENKFYAVADELPKEQIEALLSEKNQKTKEPKYDTLIAGMAPYGKLAIWLSGNGITTEVAWLEGKEIDLEMADFAPDSKLSQDEYAQKALIDCKEAGENLQNNGLPDPALFEKYMQKFNYRITPKFENAELEGIELFYYNGELNTTNSGEHATCAMRAKPCKIVLNWRIGKTQYGGYFWTEEKKIIETFKSFYGDDAQKEGNLIIEIDNSNKDFKFFLQNDETSIELPAEEMQYIIFKNKFEFHRRKNYNKPKGGWIN
jgi:hypothetical protein